MEIWRDVVGWEGVYKVSNTGKLLALRTWVGRGGRHQTAGLLYPNSQAGVNLCGRGPKRVFRIYNLVLEAFVGPCPSGMECCHWDDDRNNNRLENLRWASHKENMEDRNRNGNTVRGEKVALSVLDPNRVSEMRKRWDSNPVYWTLARLASEYGVCTRTAYLVTRRKTWKHVP